MLDAIGRRDIDKLIALSHPDAEWHSLFAGLERGGVYHGHGGARQYMADLDEAWEVGFARVDDALGVGETAVLVGEIHYRGRGSGVENSTPVVWVIECRDGKIARFRAYRDPEKMLRGIGQPP